jgi:hypothetical protein
MPTQALSDVDAIAALDLFHRYGNNMTRTAAAAGVSRSTMQSRLHIARKRGLTRTPMLEPQQIDDETLPVEELRRRRKEQFAHLDRVKKQKLLIPVKVRADGPIGLSHFGDPHLDDDGTDMALIERHVQVIANTKGMFAVNIGDAINNWTGRLARLYGEQSTSAKEAWALCEWFVRALPWAVFLGGNHGAWSGAGDPVRWMLNNCATLYDDFAVRVELQFPNGKRVRLNARHDFAGHSMWNTVHGPLKAATMGWRDHLLTCGHLHTSGYAVLKDPSSGLVSHALRVASYKTWDRYAHEKGLPNQNIFCNAVTVIDPRFEDNDPRLIHTCFDVEQGADYLKWLRSKK